MLTKYYLITFLISMVPIVELRGAIPVAVGFGLPLVPSPSLGFSTIFFWSYLYIALLQVSLNAGFFLIQKNLTNFLFYTCFYGAMVLYYKRVHFYGIFLKKNKEQKRIISSDL